MSAMRALVVYESMFGNTEEIAQAVAKGVRLSMAADLAEVATAPGDLPEGVDLLVVGGPTHAHGMSRPGTRRAAAEQARGSVVSRGDGLREWLLRLPASRRDLAVAAFDTRLGKPRWLTGSAATGAARLLRRHGWRPVVPPASFVVTSSPGPLAEGEVDRAEAWGASVARAVTPRTRAS